MMRALLIVVLIFILSACGQKVDVGKGPPVGLVRLNLNDSVRENWEKTGPRPLVTSIWYPAVEGTIMAEIGIPPYRPVFVGGHAARNAELAPSAQTYPLVVMSHGTGGAAMQMMWLGRDLAAKGYIVAAIDHHGNSAAEKKFDTRAFRMPWERTKDISAVLDLLLTDLKWAPHIDKSKIGAIGFSLGGYSVTALAGARLDFNQFMAFCKSALRDATCEEQSEYPEAGAEFEELLKTDTNLASRMKEQGGDYRDDRVGAVVALAPALAQALTIESLKGIDVPYLTIVGEADQIAPAKTNAKRLTEHIKNSHLKLIPKSGHYIFLNKCNRRGKRFVSLCEEAKGASKALVHKQTIDDITVFFERYLR